MFITEINYGGIMLCEEYENIIIQNNIKNILCFNNEILIFGEDIYKINKNSSL